MSTSFETKIFDFINRQRWLDRLAGPVQHWVNRIYRGSGPVNQGIENFLNGVWIGHPFHPAITDIPVGAWTAGVVLDALDLGKRHPRYTKAADLAIGVGAASAVVAAAAGFTDWQHLRGESRRVGILHALLNTVSLLLMTGSLFARPKNRSLGQGLAFAGYGVVFASAFLGGDLVFRQRIGVDHSTAPAGITGWTGVLPEGQLGDGVLTRVDVEDIPVLLLRRGEHVYAINEVCSHMGGPLSEGRLEGDTVICPWHGSRFSLKTGNVIDGPAAFPEYCYEARIQNGMVEIRPMAHEVAGPVQQQAVVG